MELWLNKNTILCSVWISLFYIFQKSNNCQYSSSQMWKFQLQTAVWTIHIHTSMHPTGWCWHSVASLVLFFYYWFMLPMHLLVVPLVLVLLLLLWLILFNFGYESVCCHGKPVIMFRIRIFQIYNFQCFYLVTPKMHITMAYSIYLTVQQQHQLSSEQ